MTPPLVTMRSVSLYIGERSLFSDLDLHVQAKDRLCVVGRNASGKSTLLKLIAGKIELDEGQRVCRPGLRISLLEQELDVGSGNQMISDYVSQILTEVNRDQHRTAAILERLALDPARLIKTLSGGEVRRMALARALACDPELLLLDEPTNHLDVETIEWLEVYLNGFPGAVVLVSHDRALLGKFSHRVAWLHDGLLRHLDAGFKQFERWSEEVEVSGTESNHKLDRKILVEEHWLRHGITARRKRNQGRLRKLQALRAERRNLVVAKKKAVLNMDATLRSGRAVIEAENVSKRYGERVLVKDLSVRIMRGDRIAVVGPNGVGKTTLLRMLIGDLEPDEGYLRLGARLEIIYFDQWREVLDPDQTLWQTICPNGGEIVNARGRSQHVVGYLSDFFFDESQARSPVSSLSGGEQSRLLIARLFARPGNLLALDEPTNDLDVETLDLLQEALSEYDGTVLLVSHDRDFIDRIATSTLVLNGIGAVVEYIGGYSDYLRLKPKSAIATLKRNHRTTRVNPRVRTSLGYKEQRELEGLPQEIETLSKKIARAEILLADVDFYRKDPAAFEVATADLAKARAALTQSENRWFELEDKRDSLRAKTAK